MQITIFGANGKVGSLVVKQALSRGIKVAAFVHGKNSLGDDNKLKIMNGDIYNSNDVVRALEGSSSVISALGSWGTSKKNVQETGIKHLIPAMHSAGLSRIISLTGTSANAFGDDSPLLHNFTRNIIKFIAPEVVLDGEMHIKLLENSALNWTVIRSPIMNNFGKYSYQLANKRSLPWLTINRNAVATCMLDQLEDTKYYHSAPYIKR